MNIFFITGTSGAGKTTIIHELKQLLPPTHFTLYDFDEIGVPTNPDQTWRINTSNYWLKKSMENYDNKLITIICGVSVPSEIIKLIDTYSYPIIPYFGFMKIDDPIIEKRLKNRGWNEKVIQDNINWAHYLEEQVRNQKNQYIINTSHLSPEQSAYSFFSWIKKNQKID